MFCKWCGKTIQITDVNCPNCGRETPPLSDCGGFYNLKTPDAAAPQGGDKPSQTVMDCPVVEKLESKYMHDRKADKAHHKLTVILFAVVCVLVAVSIAFGILAAAKAKEAAKEVTRLQRDIYAIQELLEETELTDETVPEPSVIPAPEETIPEETIPEETEPVKEPNAVAVTEEVNDQGETVFMVQYHNDIELFADGEIHYLWQYSKDTESWQSVDEDLLQMNEDGASVLACTDEFMKRIDVQEQKIELCCVIQCTNESGDTMEIRVRGMFIGEETSDIAFDENTETTEANNTEQ